MVRVVQDSDDENELASPLPQEDHDHVRKAESGQVTDSWGDLLQGIHDAQEALAAPAVMPNLTASRDTCNLEATMPAPLTSSKRRHTMKTYGNPFKQTEPLVFEGVERFEVMRCKNEVPERRVSDEWLPSTLQDDFVQHCATNMFSEHSSTIPDNTMSQQRMIQQAMIANNLAAASAQSKIGHTQNSDSSIPWSAYKATPKKVPTPSRERQCDDNPLPSTQPPSSLKRRSQSMNASTRSLSTPQRASHDESPLNSPSQQQRHPQDSSQRSCREKTISPRRRPKSITKPVKRISEIEVHDGPTINIPQSFEGVDQLTEDWSGENHMLSSKQLVSDGGDLWIGMPEENYRPRPSRSRSIQVKVNDYLKATDHTIPPKSKRRKTSHDVAQSATHQFGVLPGGLLNLTDDQARKTLPIDATSQPIRAGHLVSTQNKENDPLQGPNPPTKVSTSKEASTRSTFVEVVIPPPGKRRYKSNIESQTPVSNESAVLSPKSSGTPEFDSRERPKARRGHTTAVPGHSQQRSINDSDESDAEVSPFKSFMNHVVEPAIASAPQSSRSKIFPPAQNKRGRGRPRKGKTGHTSIDDVIVQLDRPSKALQPKEGTCGTILESSAASPKQFKVGTKCSISASLEVGEDDKITIEAEVCPQAEFVEKTAVPPSTPQQLQQARSAHQETPERKISTNGTTKHSPISKGNVAYRVGLSKRARIAPLLRVMKK